MDVGSFLKKFKESRERDVPTLSNATAPESSFAASSLSVVDVGRGKGVAEKGSLENIMETDAPLYSDEDTDSLSSQEGKNSVNPGEDDLVHIFHSSSKRIKRVATNYAIQTDNEAVRKDYAPLKLALTNIKSGIFKRGEVIGLEGVSQKMGQNRCRSLVEAKRSTLTARRTSITSAGKERKRSREDGGVGKENGLENHFSPLHTSGIPVNIHSYIAFENESLLTAAHGQLSVDDLLDDHRVDASLEALIDGDTVDSFKTFPSLSLQPSEQLEFSSSVANGGIAQHQDSAPRFPSADHSLSAGSFQSKNLIVSNCQTDSSDSCAILSDLSSSLKEKSSPALLAPRKKKMSLFEMAKAITKVRDSNLESKIEELEITRL